MTSKKLHGLLLALMVQTSLIWIILTTNGKHRLTWHFFHSFFVLGVDSVKMDSQLDQKISKRRFFQDIKNSFQWVIGNGLKPTQFFSFQNILTNTVARDVQSFGQNGPWLAGWLSNGLIFFCQFGTILWWTNAEKFKKISWSVFD